MLTDDNFTSRPAFENNNAISGRRKTAFSVVGSPEAEQVVPHSVEAEEAVLGSLIIDRDAIVKVAGLLSPEDFFSEERANLYRAMLGLYQLKEPGDLVTLKDHLKTMRLLGDGEGQVRPSYLIELLRASATPVHVLFYAERVRKYSALRKIMQLGSKATGLSFDVSNEPGELLSALGGQLQELLNWWSRGQEAGYFLRHEASLDYIDRWNTKKEEVDPQEKSGQVRLRFGFVCLDGQSPTSPWSMDGVEPTMLLMRSTLTALVADTSVGKTILAEQIAEANAKAGASVLFFHNELSHEQMLWRRNTRLTGIPVWKQAENERLSQQDLEQLVRASARVHGWKGRIDYVFCPDWSAREIAEEARVRHMSLTAATGKGYDLVVTDYLQNMGVEDGREMRSEKVARNVHALHTMANELEVAVLFTSQLTRDGTRDEGFIKPTLHGGLDSGSIERHSNQVLGLWRDGTKAELSCLKSTFGRRGWQQELQFIDGRLEFLE